MNWRTVCSYSKQRLTLSNRQNSLPAASPGSRPGDRGRTLLFRNATGVGHQTLVWSIKLAGSHPDWVLAKDVILEMLRRHEAGGAKGRIIEYYGPGLASLSAMDRHVIARMGAELGAATSVFPSDPEVRRFLKRQKRDQDWGELTADRGATYDLNDYRRADGCCTAIYRRLTAESARTAGVPM